MPGALTRGEVSASSPWRKARDDATASDTSHRPGSPASPLRLSQTHVQTKRTLPMSKISDVSVRAALSRYLRSPSPPVLQLFSFFIGFLLTSPPIMSRCAGSDPSAFHIVVWRAVAIVTGVMIGLRVNFDGKQDFGVLFSFCYTIIIASLAAIGKKFLFFTQYHGLHDVTGAYQALNVQWRSEIACCHFSLYW